MQHTTNAVCQQHESFAISIKIITRQLAAIDKNKLVGAKSGQILKMCEEIRIPYLAHLLDISIYNGTIPSDWRKSHGGSYLQTGATACWSQITDPST
jgi:hypothetical protein